MVKKKKKANEYKRAPNYMSQRVGLAVRHRTVRGSVLTAKPLVFAVFEVLKGVSKRNKKRRVVHSPGEIVSN